MNCSQCGATVPAGAAFCPQCGNALEGGNVHAAANLQPGAARRNGREVPEEDLWIGRYSSKAMIGPFMGGALLVVLGLVAASFVGPPAWLIVGAAALLIFAYLGLQLFYRRMSVEYRLTTHRLVLHKGILSRSDDRILLVDVDDITVRQGFVERMLNIGTITLNTSDESTKAQGKGVLVMSGIEDVRHVGDVLDEARRTERSRRGLYMMNA